MYIADAVEMCLPRREKVGWVWSVGDETLGSDDVDTLGTGNERSLGGNVGAGRRALAEVAVG